MERKTHTIDAEGKVLGRLAVEVACFLRGKHKPDFYHHKDIGDFVEVKNVAKIKFTGKKLEKKSYKHHTGFLGGLKEVPLKKVFEKNPSEVLKRAVYGMLPKNKLRPNQIKRLRVR